MNKPVALLSSYFWLSLAACRGGALAETEYVFAPSATEVHETRNKLPAGSVYIIATLHTQMIRRISLSILLLILVAIVATVELMQLHHNAWVAQGESPVLWDWTYVLMEGLIPFAVAQYVAVAGAFALAWVLWSGKWRLVRNILIVWGITWLPVVVLSTGDVTASSGGPFNFPMSMFAVPFFAFICLVELGGVLLFRAFRSTRGKVNPTAKQLTKQTYVSQGGDR